MPMDAVQITRRLNVIEGLLRTKDFDVALALAIDVDEAVTALSASAGSVRFPSHLRMRARAVRWAGEVGRHLETLAASDASRGHASAWRWRRAGRSCRPAGGLLGRVLARRFPAVAARSAGGDAVSELLLN
jgi:hypothetical protein